MRGQNFIHNEVRYQAAIDARIKANRVIGNRKRFMAVPANKALFDEVHSVLYKPHGVACGQSEPERVDEYGDRWGGLYLCYDCDHNNKMEGCGYQREMGNGKAPAFLWKMNESFVEWGSWSDGQMAAIRKVIDQHFERDAKFAEQKAERAKASNWVGKVGERSEYDLRVVRVGGFEGHYGYVYVHAFVDDDGNEFVHMGAPIADKSGGDFEPIAKGDRVRLKASIKGHSEYEGIKQSKLSRPVLLAVERALQPA